MSIIIRIERRLTSQPGTSFIISASRARAARERRYASRSPSAKRSGTRCKRLHTFSRCNSLCSVYPCDTAHTDKRVTMSSRAQQKPVHLIRAREPAEDTTSKSGKRKGQRQAASVSFESAYFRHHNTTTKRSTAKKVVKVHVECRTGTVGKQE